ncbi:hypothetical protein Patl1_03886 [Pistacia atlantica]|uniref:Uncharacterized protein n=1 Tax=Pistacia atlantica TaxID=434234 RepID=A0ACC1BRU2_9ROSI|nr:hypothetical protein Patl1_03886 [Pistacia atlantica]
MHQGKQTETLVRFLKARDWNVSKAHKMRPIIPAELYRSVQGSRLIGLSGYSKEGLPVIAVGVGLSTYDKASPAALKKYDQHMSTCLKILDMTGLKLSALNQIKLMTAISTVDDLNYPEKTETYYIVNAPYIFSACFKNSIYTLLTIDRWESLNHMDYNLDSLRPVHVKLALRFLNWVWF